MDEIVPHAQSHPGYEEWCRHQHEIQHRATEWARCGEASRYFHYGDANGKYKARIEAEPVEDLPNWKQQQQASARSQL